MRDSVFTTADGLLRVPYADVSHVCLTGSIHALLQYLLLFDHETTARHTAYFTGYAVSRDIASHLPGVWLSMRQTGHRSSTRRMAGKLALRLTATARWPFLRTARLLAFDVGFVPPLLGCRPYELLSDGPLGMEQNMQAGSAEYLRQQARHHSLQGRLEELLFGPAAVFGWGNNPQCREFWLTEENRADIYRGRPVHIASLREMWDSASAATRELVCRVFDVGGADVALLGSRPVMFLTQPLVHDGLLTEAEYLALLRPIVDRYGEGRMLFKLHPRDTFDYRTHFPRAAVYGKRVNMQLLVLLGAGVERAATFCSSSISSFPESVEADWWGVDLHPALRAWFGEMALPRRRLNMIS